MMADAFLSTVPYYHSLSPCHSRSQMAPNKKDHKNFAYGKSGAGSEEEEEEEMHNDDEEACEEVSDDDDDDGHGGASEQWH